MPTPFCVSVTDSVRNATVGSKSPCGPGESVFWAFSPLIRPIPPGLQLINVDVGDNVSAGLPKARVVRDPYRLPITGVSFLAWTQPTAMTKPMVFESDSGGVLTVYVLPTDITTYQSMDGRCLPSPHGTSILDCYLYYSEDVTNSGPVDTSPGSLMSYIDLSNKVCPMSITSFLLIYAIFVACIAVVLGLINPKIQNGYF